MVIVSTVRFDVVVLMGGMKGTLLLRVRAPRTARALWQTKGLPRLRQEAALAVPDDQLNLQTQRRLSNNSEKVERC